MAPLRLEQISEVTTHPGDDFQSADDLEPAGHLDIRGVARQVGSHSCLQAGSGEDVLKTFGRDHGHKDDLARGAVLVYAI